MGQFDELDELRMGQFERMEDELDELREQLYSEQDPKGRRLLKQCIGDIEDDLRYFYNDGYEGS